MWSSGPGKLRLYYTRDDNDNPPLCFDSETAEVGATVDAFSRVVERIQNKDFSGKAEDSAPCAFCDFRYHCHGVKRRYVTCPVTPDAVNRAEQTTLKKAGQNRSPQDQFVHDLAKNPVRVWLEQSGIAVQEYDRIRRDDFRGGWTATT